jgi:hypothetical protein
MNGHLRALDPIAAKREKKTMAQRRRRAAAKAAVQWRHGWPRCSLVIASLSRAAMPAMARLDPTMQLDDRRCDEFSLEVNRWRLEARVVPPPQQGRSAQETARGPSGLPAPIQEQANRGFEPPVFLRGFLVTAQQSHALRCTGDKDEELLGQRFRIAKFDHAAIGIDRQDTDDFAKRAMAIALDKELRKAGESGCFGNEQAMKGKNLGPERQVQEPSSQCAKSCLDIFLRRLENTENSDLFLDEPFERAGEQCRLVRIARVDEAFGDRRVAGDLVNRGTIPTLLQKKTGRHREQVVMPSFGFLPGRPASGTALE